MASLSHSTRKILAKSFSPNVRNNIRFMDAMEKKTIQL